MLKSILYFFLFFKICSPIIIVPNSRYDDYGKCSQEHNETLCKTLNLETNDMQCCIQINKIDSDESSEGVDCNPLIKPITEAQQYMNTEKGKAIFECVELGKIKSTEDNLFDEVHVFPEKNKVKQNSKKVNAKPVEFAINGQRIMLDNTWHEKLDYMWVQNDDAIITMMTYTKDGADKDAYYYQYYLLRSFLQCKDNTFVD